MPRESRAPLIVLLLLPVVYVGSYLVMVEHGSALPYRSEVERSFFWPLEQVDRKLRPLTWGKITWERTMSRG